MWNILYSRFFIAVFLGIILLSQTIPLGYSQWTDYNVHDPGTTSIMPDWFKNNAKWWSEGLISDADMINGLESLIIQDVIPLDKFVKSSSGLEHQAGVSPGSTFVNVGDKPQIPDYQKNVFGYWSDGQVSDGEIVNSIGHLMSEGIINSEKINKEIIDRKEKYNQSFGTSGLEDRTSKEFGIDSRSSATVCEDDSVCDSDKGEACAKRTGETEGKCIPTWFGIQHAWDPFLNEKIPDKVIKDLYTVTVYQELTTLILLDIKNAEIDIYDDARKNAWTDYSDNKDVKLQNIATALESIHKQTKDDASFLTDFLNQIKNDQANFEKLAKMKDIPKIELERAAEVPLLEIDDKVKPDNINEIKDAYKDAEKSNKKANGNLDDLVDMYTEVRITTGDAVSDQVGSVDLLTDLSFGDLGRILDITFDDLINDDIISTLDDGHLTEEELRGLPGFEDEEETETSSNVEETEFSSRSKHYDIVPGDDSVLIRGHGLNPGDTVNITIGAENALLAMDYVTVTVGDDGTFETTIDNLDENSEGEYGGEEGKYGVIVKVLHDSGYTVSSEDFDFEIKNDVDIESETSSPLIDALVDSFSISTQIHIAPGDDSVLIRGHGLNPGDTVNITIGAEGAHDAFGGATVTVGSDGTFETTVDDLDGKSEGPNYEGEEGKYGVIVKVSNDSGGIVSSADFDFEIESEIESNIVIKQISTLVIGGNHFPKSQFFTADPDICESKHYHAGIVYSIEGTAAEETQGECGFGSVDSLDVITIDLTQEEFDTFKSLTGIDL